MAKHGLARSVSIIHKEEKALSVDIVGFQTCIDKYKLSPVT